MHHPDRRRRGHHLRDGLARQGRQHGPARPDHDGRGRDRHGRLRQHLQAPPDPPDRGRRRAAGGRGALLHRPAAVSPPYRSH
ncbi:hypothetical protein SBRY_50759 [Actinacidiphila bryophytorum]|uniref:Uncharacterized protein n=1 Tax=Actinacidiphila bryophytorum TaxID=1436133 RepID=A0A9W4H4W9_9ACTN|nr:hypothetical protein SBRY_50759 [Actinacidiphila bryophytorum]